MPKRKSQIPSRQLCEDKDCKGIARFGFNENTKEIRFCLVHKLPGMERLDLEFEASMSSEISPAEVNAPPQKKTKTTVHIPKVSSQEIEGVASEVAVDIGLAKLKPAKSTSLNGKGNLRIFIKLEQLSS